MKLYLLFGQRENAYPGEYGPELLDAIDEYTDEDNPDYLNDAYKKHSLSGQFISVIIVSTNVDDGELVKLLSVNEIKSTRIEIV